jgi:hypothetical protein
MLNLLWVNRVRLYDNFCMTLLGIILGLVLNWIIGVPFYSFITISIFILAFLLYGFLDYRAGRFQKGE